MQTEALLEQIGRLIGRSITPVEGRRLYELGCLATAPIVEIGTHKGKSACYLAAGANVLVYALDLWDSPDHEDHVPVEQAQGFYRPDTWEAFIRQIDSVGMRGRIVPIKGSSFETGAHWRMPIGVLHIDGNHSFAGCSKDYENFSPQVVPGGYIALHDRHHPGVRQLIAEIVEPSGLWRDVELVDWLWIARRREAVG